MQAIRSAIVDGAPADEFASLEVPGSFLGAGVRADEQEMFAGLPSEEKDPRKSIHVDEVELPELAPDEALVAVMASSINFNTVWTSIFEPLPTFPFLARLGKESVWGKRHDLPFHVVGSDAAGVVLRVGSAVRMWKPGDAVTVHSNHVDDQDPTRARRLDARDEPAHLGLRDQLRGARRARRSVKANQLMPKPAHLTWEEAAVNALTNATSYRMLVSPNGAQMQQGQTVLVWGAGSGIGAYACQYVLNGGGTPVAVVSSAERAAVVREMGVEHVIDRKEENFQFWKDEHTQDPAEWRRLGKKIRDLAGTDPDIVFEHPGRQTMGASVFACTRGGMIITCAATTGFMLEYDNRYLWMNQKTLKGCHYANYREAWEANKLVCDGKIQPVLSAVFPFEETGEAVAQVHANAHEGKLGVLVLAPEEGLGVTDPEMRERLLDKITLFRR